MATDWLGEIGHGAWQVTVFDEAFTRSWWWNGVDLTSAPDAEGRPRLTIHASEAITVAEAQAEMLRHGRAEWDPVVLATFVLSAELPEFEGSELSWHGEMLTPAAVPVVLKVASVQPVKDQAHGFDYDEGPLEGWWQG